MKISGKKFGLMLVAAALVVTTVSFAGDNDVRLQFKRSPLPHGPIGMGTTTLTVDADGIVEVEQCRVIFPNPCETQEVKRLTRRESREIEQLIRQAKRGQVVPPSPFEIRCRALPTSHVSYTANNGKVVLLSGATPCGGMTRNTSKAAEKLVQILRDLSQNID